MPVELVQLLSEPEKLIVMEKGGEIYIEVVE
jgi:hypothetical protein